MLSPFGAQTVSIRVDSCELEHEIDAARADAALIAAQQALERGREPSRTLELVSP